MKKGVLLVYLVCFCQVSIIVAYLIEVIFVANFQDDVFYIFLDLRKLLFPLSLLNNLLIFDIGTLASDTCACWHLPVDELHILVLSHLVHSVVLHSTLYKLPLETFRVHGVLGQIEH